jgi:maleamate amidohydrolase
MRVATGFVTLDFSSIWARCTMSTEEIYQKQKFGQPLGFGRKSGIIVIDFQVGFTREDSFGGFNINAAIDRTAKLLKRARAAGVPIAHVRFTAQPGGFDIGSFGEKVPKLCTLTADAPDAQFVGSVAPMPGEYVSQKRHSSAFFGTTLSSWLISCGVDTLVVTGCTTSGCVRATVVDASAYGLRPIVVTDCVGDRAEAPHRSSLFDMGQKYADLLTLDEVTAHFAAAREPAHA